MKVPKITPILAAIGSVIIFGGCADFTQELTAGALFPGAATSEGYWHGDNSPGPAKIVVHVGEQRAYFYKDHRLVGESTVSTGKRGFDTPPGRYRVTEKDKNHISSEFGDYVNHRGEVVNRTSMYAKTRNLKALILMAPACLTLCDSMAAMACTPAMSLSFARRTVASGCRREWHGIFLKTPQTTPR